MDWVRRTRAPEGASAGGRRLRGLRSLRRLVVTRDQVPGLRLALDVEVDVLADDVMGVIVDRVGLAEAPVAHRAGQFDVGAVVGADGEVFVGEEAEWGVSDVHRIDGRGRDPAAAAHGTEEDFMTPWKIVERPFAVAT